MLYGMRWAPLVMLGALLLLTGCQQEQADGFLVSGTVTYQGKPVPRGTLLLTPDTSKGNSGPAVSLDIVDGKFETPSTAKTRHQGGAYRVYIDGFDGNAKPEAELPLGRALFMEYETEVTLPEEDASDITFEVKKR